MSDQNIKAILPKDLQELHIFLGSHNQAVFDLSPKVSQINLYESIDSPFVYGELTVIDNDDLINKVPLVGQEKLQIYYKYKNTVVDLVFYVSEYIDIKVLTESAGGFVISFTSVKEFYNHTSVFSKSYKGRATEIIQKIHKEYLKEDVEILSTSGTSHQMVYPYIKAYDAINMLITNTYAVDSTPVFLYDTVNSPGAKLQSLGDMWGTSNPVIVIKNANIVNTDTQKGQTGQAHRDISKFTEGADTQVIKRSFSVLDNIADGRYASNITTIDLSNKYYEEVTFDYQKNTKILHSTLKDNISPAFKFNDKGLNKTHTAYHHLFVKDGKAFESESVGNLYNVDSLNKAAMMSYYSRMNDTSIVISGDNNPNLWAGKLVNLTFKRMKPNLGGDDDIDKVNSGTYLCRSIKHEIRNMKYSINIECSRYGINKEAENI
tara:strand:- start:3 stop:1301 length:1299 start_codon:yes stop_codon:yes gene_type:complete